MGNYWLHDLPQALKNRGLPVGYFPGWETRSRSTGGFEKILGVGTHHDAVPQGTSSINRQLYAWKNAASRPIGNLYVQKNGAIVMGCAGASNTQGRSERSFQMSKGVVPQSQGNLYMISFEAENDGVGEVWPEQQLESYELAVAVTCDLYGLNPLTDVLHHWQYTSRKIDPRGPTVGRSYGNGQWSHGFQQQVQSKLEGLNDMQYFTSRRIFDSRSFNTKVEPNKNHKFDLPGDLSTAKAIQLTVGAIDPVGPGYVTVWPSGNRPTASYLNYNPTNAPIATTFSVPVENGSFFLYTSTKTHLYVDVSGRQ